MIYELFTSGQWFVIWSVTFLFLWVVWEIIIARRALSWDRNSDEPPVIVGGLVGSLVSCIALAALFGVIHGLTWMWVYG